MYKCKDCNFTCEIIAEHFYEDEYGNEELDCCCMNCGSDNVEFIGEEEE